MKREIYMSILFLVPLLINAQWERSSAPYGAAVKYVVSSGDTIIIGSAVNSQGGTQVGGVYLSFNKGSDWQFINEGLPPFVEISALAIKDSTFFTSCHGKIFRRYSSSLVWDELTNGLPAYANYSCLIIHNENILAGSNHGIMFSPDNGSHWESRNNGLVDSVIISMSSCSEYILASPLYPPSLYKSTDNGLNWHQIPDPLTNFEVINSIAIDTPTILLGTDHGVFVSIDNGNTWEKKNAGLTDTLINSIIFREDKIFVATEREGIFCSEDYGNLWYSVNEGIWSNKTKVLSENGQDLFAGTFGGVFTLSNNGSSWTSVNNGLIELPIYAVLSIDATILIGTQFGVFCSFNLGQDWEITTNGFSGSSFFTRGLTINDSIIYASTVGEPYVSGVLYKSNDNGNSWDTTGLNSGGSCSVLTLDSLLFATSGGWLYRSIDSGNTWEIVLHKQVSSITSLDSILFAGAYGEGIFSSSDFGESWIEKNNGIENKLIKNLISKSNKLYSTANFDIYRSNDTGDSWETIKKGIPSEFYPKHLIANDSTLFIGGSGVCISSNSGDEWFEMNDGFPSIISIQSLSIYEEDYLLAGTYNAGLWKIPLSGLYSLEVHPDTLWLGNLAFSSDTSFIKTNTAWWIQDSLPEWLTSNIESGTSSDKIIFKTIQPNPNEVDRSVSIQISSLHAPPDSIHIVQKGISPGIDDLQSVKVFIYPNPAKDFLNFKSEDVIISITVFNAIGNEIEEINPKSKSCQMNVSRYHRGIYLVKLTGKKFITHEMIVLQ